MKRRQLEPWIKTTEQFYSIFYDLGHKIISVFDTLCENITYIPPFNIGLCPKSTQYLSHSHATKFFCFEAKILLDTAAIQKKVKEGKKKTSTGGK